MAEGMFKTAPTLTQKAVESVTKKYIPSRAIVPEEKFKSIFDKLEVWDKDRNDEDLISKTKYIYDNLLPNGDPKSQLTKIFTILGSTPLGETKIDRVYRYIRLRQQAQEHITNYENVSREIEGMKQGDKDGGKHS